MVGMAQCEEEAGEAAGAEKAVRGGVEGGEKAVFREGRGEKLLRQSEGRASAPPPPSPSPPSLAFDMGVQGHEPREEWQCGPAPGQTGSHRTGPASSSPRLTPPKPPNHIPTPPPPPRLAPGFTGSQGADPPQWSGPEPRTSDSRHLERPSLPLLLPLQLWKDQ